MYTIDTLEVELKYIEKPDANIEVKRKMLSELLARWLERAYRARELQPKESAEIPPNNGRKPLISPHDM